MESQPSDSELILDVLEGQTHRFAEIVRRYRGALLRAAESRLKRRDLAEDLVQETFLCMYKSLHTYDSRYSFRTWMWTILLNQCRRRHKRESRHPEIHPWSMVEGRAGPGESSLAPVAMASGEAGPADQAMAREQAAVLESLLDQLPEVQADALRLRFFGGLKFHEIAEAMGCSLSSAKQRVRLGLTRMSELMSGVSCGGDEEGV
jgi:RNA polymerase sigma-70 factor (ECF subfamily)